MSAVSDMVFELKNLVAAKELLERIWSHMDLHTGEIPKDIRREMERFFSYDDSI